MQDSNYLNDEGGKKYENEHLDHGNSQPIGHYWVTLTSK